MIFGVDTDRVLTVSTAAKREEVAKAASRLDEVMAVLFRVPTSAFTAVTSLAIRSTCAPIGSVRWTR